MGMTPEGRVKDNVKKILKKYRTYYHMVVQNGMGAPSLDFVGCHYGDFFAVETKAPGKKPTPRQEVTMEAMEKAGGRTFVVAGDEGMEELEEWLEYKQRQEDLRNA